MLSHGIDDFASPSGSGREEVCNKFKGKERRPEREMILLRTRGPSDLEQVASGSAAQDLWLEDRNL